MVMTEKGETNSFSNRKQGLWAGKKKREKTIQEQLGNTLVNKKNNGGSIKFMALTLQKQGKFMLEICGCQRMLQL